ncbi:4-hydroxybutyrate CoA-transferase [bacterium]|nr:4-hydroxybutyrate CoA-transferase [bacterium]
MNWKEEYDKKRVSLEEAASLVQSNDVVAMPIADSAPVDLMNAIAARYQELENVTIVSGLTPLVDSFDSKYQGHITHKSLFLQAFERMYMPGGNVDMIPFQWSQIEYLLKEKVRCNCLIMECSKPDRNGYLSFGPSGALFNNFLINNGIKKVIAQVNSNTPYVFGTQAHVHISQIDAFCEKDRPLIYETYGIDMGTVTENDRKIASFIVNHIKDGSTVQFGIGTIGDAVGELLENHQDLGVHSEMLTRTMVELARKGVINGKKKSFHQGKMIVAFTMGTQDFYDYIDYNPMIEFWPLPYVNNPVNIGKNDNLISINSALSVDLTGQVCSESIGHSQYSGTGGQLDFVRGARLSKNGKTFLALSSVADTDKGLVNRIPAVMPPGTIITTPRTDVQYIVTEYGIADLRYKSISDRVKAMIPLAHPDFREQLEKDALEMGLLK